MNFYNSHTFVAKFDWIRALFPSSENFWIISMMTMPLESDQSVDNVAFNQRNIYDDIVIKWWPGQWPKWPKWALVKVLTMLLGNLELSFGRHWLVFSPTPRWSYQMKWDNFVVALVKQYNYFHIPWLSFLKGTRFPSLLCHTDDIKW